MNNYSSHVVWNPFFFPRHSMPNERTDSAIPYISGQGKPRGFKQTKPPLISQGLVILYFSILFDVLTKQDDTGELALKFDFLFFFLPSFFLSLQPVSVRPVQCTRRSDWSCPPSLFILIAYLSFPLSLSFFLVLSVHDILLSQEECVLH